MLGLAFRVDQRERQLFARQLGSRLEITRPEGPQANDPGILGVALGFQHARLPDAFASDAVVSEHRDLRHAVCVAFLDKRNLRNRRRLAWQDRRQGHAEPTRRACRSVPIAPERTSITYVAFARSSCSRQREANRCCRIELIR